MGNGDIVEGARALAVIIDSNRARAIREPGDQAAPEKALQIDHPIKSMSANLQDTARRMAPTTGRGQTIAIEGNYPGEIRVGFEQGNQTAIKPPIDFGRRQMLFQE